MIFRFDAFELDTRTLELRRDGTVLAVEPQVFALLAFLVENNDRVVSKDDLLDAIWQGRIVSDAAIDSRMRSARLAIGDDGRAQRQLRTIRGRGFRFVGTVIAEPSPEPEPDRPALHAVQHVAAPAEEGGTSPAPPPVADGRPSIAVLPFAAIGGESRFGNISMALPHDLIAALSRLHWLFVISRSSSFQFQGAHGGGGPRLDGLEAARRLGVRYCLCGAVEIAGNRIEVIAELLDTTRGGIIWADRYAGSIDEVYELRHRIAGNVVAAMELRIPALEAERAALKMPESLDAWGAYHLGLRHMYRFNSHDNRRALDYFAQAVLADPAFSRAYAGLSFAHFQNAFVHFSADAATERVLARAAAEKAMEIDPLDPFANYTMGRADWLDGDLDGAIGWLQRCVDLNPNHAQAVYSGALVDTMAGRHAEVGPRIELARALSPYDPLRYAMLVTRSLALLPSGAFDDATAWAERAAREPNAHVLIHLIAAAVNELSGRPAEARGWMASARHRNPGFSQADFFLSLPYRDPAMRRMFSQVFDRLGMP
ncbi:MAG: winged helix-turn-helix domain-containing protein [Sneathiellaceae bacterium]